LTDKTDKTDYISAMYALAQIYAFELEWVIFPTREKDGLQWDETENDYVQKLEKSPYIRNGLRGAKRSKAAIEAWWKRLHPNAMIGLPTGELNGIWVLDIDVPSHEHESSGWIWLEEMQKLHGKLPETRTAKTANGGLHFYFNYVDGIRNGAGKESGLGDGVDVRGEGGYVVAPGSILADGRFYEWSCDDDTPIADAPQWLLDIVVKKHEPREYERRVSSPSPSGQTKNQRYANAVLDDEIRNLESMGAGGRGFALNQSAFKLGSMVTAGELSQAQVEDALFNAAVSNGLVATDGERQCWDKIRRGMNAGGRNPRAVPDSMHNDERSNLRLRDLKKVIERAVTKSKMSEEDARDYKEEEEPEEENLPFRMTPYLWVDPKKLAKREFVYGNHYVRKYISFTVAAGGAGKTSNCIAEALSMTSGLNLTGFQPKQKYNVWMYNAEDPIDELQRRIQACATYYKLRPDDFEGRFFLDSGREQEIVIMRDDRKNGIVTVEPLVDAIVEYFLRNKIDVAIVDPFVKTHGVNENDNGSIDKVLGLWTQIADYTNTAIELIHHTKKVEGRKVAVDDARGGSAIIGAARSIRALNVMDEKEAQAARVKADDRLSYFSIDIGKSNMAKRKVMPDWRQIVGEGNKNGTGRGGLIDQDFSPVATEFVLPESQEALTDVDDKQIELIIVNLRSGQHQVNPAGNGWAGHMVGEVLGIATDKESKDGRVQVANILAVLHEQKRISKVREVVPGRREAQWFWTTPDVAAKKFEEQQKAKEA
jgi:hypothetical protein